MKLGSKAGSLENDIAQTLEVHLGSLKAACADEAGTKDALIARYASLCVLVLVQEQAKVLLSWPLGDHLHVAATPTTQNTFQPQTSL